MNKQDLMRMRNDAARFFEFTNISGSHRNCLRLSTSNTKEHELKKFEICWELLKEGKQFLVEAKFAPPYSGRPDIVVLDDHKIIEILHSEKEIDCIKKSGKYPALFELEMIKADNV
jgi:hypothetical protein